MGKEPSRGKPPLTQYFPPHQHGFPPAFIRSGCVRLKHEIAGLGCSLVIKCWSCSHETQPQHKTSQSVSSSLGGQQLLSEAHSRPVLSTCPYRPGQIRGPGSFMYASWDRVSCCCLTDKVGHAVNEEQSQTPAAPRVHASLRGQRIIEGNWFFPSTTWVPGIEFGAGAKGLCQLSLLC